MSFGRLAYVTQRVGRNLLPDRAAAMARRLLGDIAGGESYDPDFFARHYVKSLAKAGHSFDGVSVLIFGQGPSLGFACHLLKAGARHIHLFDPYAPPEDRANRRWLERFPQYLESTAEGIRPRPEWMSLLAGQTPSETGVLADIVISTSVFEHLPDIERWAAEMARVTAPDGVNLHMIDLRDHFFHMPFEMLKYSAGTWNRWLNPRQHLNRKRYAEFETAFRNHFREVSVEVLARDPVAFAEARPKIRAEFLTGDEEIDAVTEIQITASGPVVLV